MRMGHVTWRRAPMVKRERATAIKLPACRRGWRWGLGDHGSGQGHASSDECAESKHQTRHVAASAAHPCRQISDPSAVPAQSRQHGQSTLCRGFLQHVEYGDGSQAHYREMERTRRGSDPRDVAKNGSTSPRPLRGPFSHVRGHTHLERPMARRAAGTGGETAEKTFAADTQQTAR